MMKNIILLCLSLIILFPFIHVNAIPGNAELVLDNIQIEPPYPKKGELIRITGDVYNAGIVETNSLASIVTVAYFIDDKLLHLDELGNVKPGIKEKIKISSDLIWNAEIGDHVIKVIIDYHDTLNDEYDLIADNVAEKSISIEPLDPTKIYLNASPFYVTTDKDTLLKITTRVMDSASNKFLDNKKIILNLDGQNIHLTTNESGIVSFSKSINSSQSIRIESYFEGDDQYLPSHSLLTVHSIPSEVTSAILVKIIDMDKKYNFEDYSFEFLIFQDSYENLIEKVFPISTLLDSNTLWIPLQPQHDYFAEVYLDGRFLFPIDRIQLQENSMVVEELIIPESAEIQFRVLNEIGEPQSNVIVNNWIYSAITDEYGFTDWIKVLPTVNDTPYVAEIILTDQRTIESNPFLVFSGERKTIDILINEFLINPKIPNWVRNNASWWADGQIDDSSFIEGLQFLIKENILQVPVSQNNNSISNEIPNWVRNNASWWADGQIDDQSFINVIQFLIEERIINAS